MLFVFVVDTSPSMARKFCLENSHGQQGVSRLDAAKAAVEQFVRSRQKLNNPSVALGTSMGGETGGNDIFTKKQPKRSLTSFGLRNSEDEDVYLLVKSGTQPKLKEAVGKDVQNHNGGLESLESPVDPSSHVVVGWQHPQSMFTHAVRQLQVDTGASMRSAIVHAFGLLSLARLAVGVDHFGRGWHPSKSGRTFQPGVVLVLSDSYFKGNRPSKSSPGLDNFFTKRLDSKEEASLVQEMSQYLDQPRSSQAHGPSSVHGELTLDSSHVRSFIDYSPLTASLSKSDRHYLKQGMGLSKCCHRWDHRLYSVIMVDDEAYEAKRLAEVNIPWNKLRNLSLPALSRATGGYFHIAESMTNACKTLSKIATKLSSKTQFGPLVSFVSEISSDNSLKVLRKQVYARFSGTSYWPIPEEFNESGVLRRSSHPLLYVDCEPQSLVSASEAIKVATRDLQFPFDGYDLQRSALTDKMVDLHTQKVKEGATDRSTLWSVKSYSSSEGSNVPFGVICVSEDPVIRHKTQDSPTSQGITVMMLILPWNFPWLFSLLLRLVRPYNESLSSAGSQFVRSLVERNELPMGWMESFREYVQSVPSYYRKFLANGLKKYSLDRYVDTENKAGYRKVFASAESCMKSAAIEQGQAENAQETTQQGVSDASSVGSMSSRSSHVKQWEAVHPFAKYHVSTAAPQQTIGGKQRKQDWHLLHPADSQEGVDEEHMVPMHEMSNYIPRLASRKRLRDPNNFDDTATTELERGWIHFGNPYSRLTERRNRKPSFTDSDKGEMANVDKSLDAEAQTEAAFLFKDESMIDAKFENDEAESQLATTYEQEKGVSSSQSSDKTISDVAFFKAIRFDTPLRRKISRGLPDITNSRGSSSMYQLLGRAFQHDEIPPEYLRVLAGQ
eukprot:gb/GECG01013974.1/.p1 GENE.gb/GECG01013974.1/~~gb/GECG01013974.1/.p1  ORF type:complete len:895 (+),score=105.60 gb/GECG01013974.1/:1-2685(+)